MVYHQVKLHTVCFVRFLYIEARQASKRASQQTNHCLPKLDAEQDVRDESTKQFAHVAIYEDIKIKYKLLLKLCIRKTFLVRISDNV